MEVKKTMMLLLNPCVKKNIALEGMSNEQFMTGTHGKGASSAARDLARQIQNRINIKIESSISENFESVKTNFINALENELNQVYQNIGCVNTGEKLF